MIIRGGNFSLSVQQANYCVYYAFCNFIKIIYHFISLYSFGSFCTYISVYLYLL